MKPLRLLMLASAALTGGCLLFPQIDYDLAASVVGVVGREDIRDFAGDAYADAPHFPSKFADERGRLLRIQLDTNRDLVLLAHRKHLQIGVEWHFCDKPEQEVALGEWRAFVNGMEISWLDEQSVSAAADQQGRFRYDAIGYVRGWFTSKETGEVNGRFDLGRMPRDVCVQVWLTTKIGGYKTNVAQIPKERIAAALGAKVPPPLRFEEGAVDRQPPSLTHPDR